MQRIYMEETQALEKVNRKKFSMNSAFFQGFEDDMKAGGLGKRIDQHLKKKYESPSNKTSSNISGSLARLAKDLVVEDQDDASSTGAD